MCNAAVSCAPKSRTARAAQTVESMPPLRTTSARAVGFLCGSFISLRLDTFQRWLPNELMNLQSQTGIQAIGQYPLRKITRVEQAMRCIPAAARVFAKRGGEDYRCIVSTQSV